MTQPSDQPDPTDGGVPPASTGSVRPSPVDDPAAGAREDRIREELLRRLGDAHFPATRDDLLRHIGPDQRGQLQAHLRALPPDVRFDSPLAVASAFGGITSSE